MHKTAHQCKPTQIVYVHEYSAKNLWETGHESLKS